MSQIRFGGSVASATLSAHWALPGGDIQLRDDRSTAADSVVGSGDQLDQTGFVTVARSQAITSSMMAGPSGSLWSS
jgi:ApbE superfamily uncharacterized protein (UPF0280 family)